MPKYKALLGTLLFYLAGWAAYGQGPSWKVEIKLAQTLVKSGENFSVVTAVRNTGTSEESLIVWDCSYAWQWKADNPAVQVGGVACLQNVLVRIRLKPGEAYERPVPVYVELAAGSARRELIAFRLRYENAATHVESFHLPPQNPPIWSNPVTVIVTRPSTSSQ